LAGKNATGLRPIEPTHHLQVHTTSRQHTNSLKTNADCLLEQRLIPPTMTPKEVIHPLHINKIQQILINKKLVKEEACSQPPFHNNPNTEKETSC